LFESIQILYMKICTLYNLVAIEERSGGYDMPIYIYLRVLCLFFRF